MCTSRQVSLRIEALMVLTIASLLVALSGCGGVKPNDRRSEEAVAVLFDRLCEIGARENPGESNETRMRRVDDKIEEVLSRVTSASILRDLYIQCEEFLEAKRGRWDEVDRLQDVLGDARPIILGKIGDMRNDEAARVLAKDLLGSSKLSFDGESAINIMNAITTCGRPCLKYLIEIGGERQSFVRKMIGAIERGEILGP